MLLYILPSDLCYSSKNLNNWLQTETQKDPSEHQETPFFFSHESDRALAQDAQGDYGPHVAAVLTE